MRLRRGAERTTDALDARLPVSESGGLLRVRPAHARAARPLPPPDHDGAVPRLRRLRASLSSWYYRDRLGGEPPSRKGELEP